MTDSKPAYVHKPWELGGLPRFSEITGIQAALTDNGPEKKTTKRGRKSTEVRFKMIVEVYTAAPEWLNKRIPAFKRNVELRRANEFIKLVTGQLKDGRISQSYHDYLLDGVVGMPLADRERCLFGQIRENNNGWRYFDHEYVVFEELTDSGVLHVMARQDDGEVKVMSVSQFNDHFANGVIKLTAYLDVNDQLKRHKESKSNP